MVGSSICIRTLPFLLIASFILRIWGGGYFWISSNCAFVKPSSWHSLQHSAIHTVNTFPCHFFFKSITTTGLMPWNSIFLLPFPFQLWNASSALCSTLRGNVCSKNPPVRPKIMKYVSCGQSLKVCKARSLRVMDSAFPRRLYPSLSLGGGGLKWILWEDTLFC